MNTKVCTMTTDLNKIIGSVLIIVGTCIGAGILGLPMVGAPLGFLRSSILVFGLWLLMTFSALVLLEVNLRCPDDANGLSSMAYQTLGRTGQVITWITILLLLTCLLATYTAGGGSLLKNLISSSIMLDLPSWASALIFIGILGIPVFLSTKVVDYTNRFLISIKGLLLVIAILCLASYVDFSKLSPVPEIYRNECWAAAAPIFLCAFGFHMVIPSLRDYVGPKRKDLRLIIIIGSLIPMVIYLLWLLVTLCVIPLNGTNSFNTITLFGNSIGELMGVLTRIASDPWTVIAIKGFFNISMTTSFLGVALALFDFLSDGLKLAHTKWGRLQTAVLTFLPPLIFALYYPEGFILALGYASCFVVISLLLLPMAMAYSLCCKENSLAYNASGNIFFNRYLLLIAMVIGVILLIISIIMI